MRVAADASARQTVERHPGLTVAAARKKNGSEKVRLRIGNLAQAVLVTGQAYQDPKDALNEFVSNAADEYALSGRHGERIRVVLRRKGKYPLVAVDDVGRGMDPDRLRELARNLFKSTKVGDDRTLGEKAIGLLAFQQLAGRCDIVSRIAGSDETWVLRLERGQATASLERAKAHRRRDLPGTTVYLTELDPDALRVLTQRKVVDYLRKRRGPALEAGTYVLEVVEGRTGVIVTPDEPDGVPVKLATQRTLWGPIEFALYVAPPDSTKREVAVVGRAGTTILDSLADIEEFAGEPWSSNQVSGRPGELPATERSPGATPEPSLAGYDTSGGSPPTPPRGPDSGEGSQTGGPARLASPRSPSIRTLATFGVASTPTSGSFSTTIVMPTISSSRITSRRCWTISPPWSPRSTSCTTTRGPSPTTWPRRWSAC